MMSYLYRLAIIESDSKQANEEEINEIWTNEEIPEEWNTASTLYPSHKKDASDSKN